MIEKYHTDSDLVFDFYLFIFFTPLNLHKRMNINELWEIHECIYMFQSAMEGRHGGAGGG